MKPRTLRSRFHSVTTRILTRSVLLSLAVFVRSAFAQPIEPVRLDWLGGQPPATPQSVSWGVPWPKGKVQKSDSLVLKAADGKIIPAYTYVPGLYERSARHNNQAPYELAPRWAEAKAALDPKTPFDLVTTNDIVGGNSGSAMVNKKGELVGLIFDGNIQSLPGYVIYEEAVNRAVSVDSRIILEALRKVYKADALATEIAGAAGKKK